MNAETFCEHFATFAEAPGGVAKLRELIFRLSVQGKVAPQKADDEPASELFNQIQSERSRLIANGVMRRSKPLPPVIDDELDFQIPATWKWIRFDDVGDWGAGATPNRGRPEYFGGDIKWFKSGELNDAYIDDSEEKITELALKECSLRENKAGDVLVAMYGATIGKVAILDVPATTNQAVCACTCHSGIFNRYLFLMLKAFKAYFISNSSGAAQPNFSKEKIVRTPFPLPPLAEQRRIVAKVDQLLGLCDELAARQEARRTARERLVVATLADLTSPRDTTDRIAPAQRLQTHFDTLFDTPTTIPHLRQTIRALALDGVFTRLWREQARSSETGRHFVESVTEMRKRLLQERSSAKSPHQIESGSYGELPDGWLWASIDELTSIVTSGSRGWKEYYANKGSLFIRSQDIKTDSLNLTSPAFVALPTKSEGQRTKVDQGDLLITITGANVGKAAVVESRLDDAYVSQHVALIRPVDIRLAPFAHLWLTAELRGRGQLLSKSYGDKPGLNLDNIRTLPIPIPPLAEQAQIVAKVTELLAWCDTLERQLQATETTSTQLLTAAVQHLLSPTQGRPT